MAADQRRQNGGMQANCDGGIFPLGLALGIRSDLLFHQKGTTPSRGNGGRSQRSKLACHKAHMLGVVLNASRHGAAIAVVVSTAAYKYRTQRVKPYYH